MVRRRHEACCRMLTKPQHIDMADVGAVFLEDCRDRYYTGHAAVDTGSAQVAEASDAIVDFPFLVVARVFSACNAKVRTDSRCPGYVGAASS